MTTEIWAEKRPSRLKVANTYAKRIVRWRDNNQPFISGDVFADNADISIYPPRFRGSNPTLRQLREAKVIFCPSDRLGIFLEQYKGNINAKVIICGNSDFEFHEIPTNLPKSVSKLFLQNSHISDGNRIFTLPIGIENYRWGVNGNPKNLRFTSDFLSKKNEIVVGPLGLTHPARIQVRNDLNIGLPGIRFLSERLSPTSFAELTSQFKYVAAVRGNGVDTHRLWESLYRGQVPIVTRNVWSLSLEELNLPILQIDSWDYSELKTVLDAKKDFSFNPASLKPLWWSFWKDRIAKCL